MKSMRQWLALWVLSAIVFGEAAAASPDLVIPKAVGDTVQLRIPSIARGLDVDTLVQRLSIFVSDDKPCCENKLAISGQYELKNNFLIFKPDFPFQEGQNYIVHTGMPPGDAPANDRALEFTQTVFVITRTIALPKAGVAGIFPSGDALPENTLRFYIYFTTPMKPQVALQHIKLVGEDGVADTRAFMRFKQELWSPDRKRLTLLLDPGRIKRNVATNLELGPALVAGKQYQLIVSSGWETAMGEALPQDFVKNFAVSDALRTLPDPQDWQIFAPKLGSREPLTIHFDRPYDQALLRRFISVKISDDEEILGRVSLSDHETAWVFTPDQSWAAKNIYLHINGSLEDVAGNNFRDLLDHTVDQGSKDITNVRLPILLN